jgi:biotin-(acetyl-CoA carboxylase) ligase
VGGDAGNDAGGGCTRATLAARGEKVEAVLRVLVGMNGAATVREIAKALGDKWPRDLLRNSLKRTGVLVKLQQYGIIEIRGDGIDALVELSPDWRRDLDLARAVLGEYEAASRDYRQYEAERERFAEYLALREARERERGRARKVAHEAEKARLQRERDLATLATLPEPLRKRVSRNLRL